LQHHYRLFNLLSVSSMSGDESDGTNLCGERTYRIVNARWQSASLRKFLRTLDALHREACLAPKQRLGRWTYPIIRLETSGAQEEDGTPPVGLWRNCYDPAWLESLDVDRHYTLQIIDEDYDFAVPQGGEDLYVKYGEKVGALGKGPKA
ncbi:hypothetical protein C8Q78DRAFT_963590, partial [Trametes maxima]